MSMATLAPHTMNLTQMVAETTTPKNSLPLENAAYAEAEAPETIALEISHGTCTSQMMKLMDMPISGLKIQSSTHFIFGTSQMLLAL